MNFEIAFMKAFGRAPTPVELERVRRVGDAFEVRDNDALMAMAGLLVFYDGASRETLNKGADVSREMANDCADTLRKTLDDWLSAGGRLLVEAVARTIDRRLEMGAAKYASAARRAWMEASTGLSPAVPSPSAHPLSALDWGMLFGWLVLYSVFFGILCLLIGALWGRNPSLFGNTLAPAAWIVGLDVLVLAGAWSWQRQRVKSGRR